MSELKTKMIGGGLSITFLLIQVQQKVLFSNHVKLYYRAVWVSYPTHEHLARFDHP